MNWVLLTAIGGFIGLDATSFPQAMFSRPLIAATLGGLVFGQPVAGLLVGVFLEMFSLVILPFGAARYPESGTAAAAAGAAYAQHVDLPLEPGPLLLAVVFALAWEHITGASVIFLRRLNERLVSSMEYETDAVRAVERRHLFALGLDYVRGAWAVLIGAVACMVLMFWVAPMLALDSTVSGRVLAVAAAAMLASVMPLIGGIRTRWLTFGLGAICGSLLVLL